MNFLAPWLLGGMALASTPIVIHLLNRRRFTVVDWAPMRYLKLTLKTNRRRLRLEQWLLLAIRTLALIALFLAIARPVVSSTGLGALIGGQGRTSRVIVIDDSLSMAAKTGGRSALSRAQEAATALIERVGTQDSLTLTTTTAPDMPLVRNSHIEDSDKLVDQIEALEPKDAAASWSAVLPVVEEHLQGGAYPVQTVTLVTDLRGQGWSSQVTEQAADWAKRGVNLRIINVGGPVPDNAAIVGLDQADRIALVRTPLVIKAKIRLAGSRPPADNQAVLKVDGQPRPIPLPDLTPGQTSELRVEPKFEKAGQHTLELELPEDPLANDNHRWLTVDVKDQLDLTLVDGEPAARAFASETDFLQLATTIGQVPWGVKRLVDSQWLANPSGAPDVLVLANVASIPEARANELRRMVEAGMGLMIFPGGRIDPAAYNDTLDAGDQGLLPARLEGVEPTEAEGLIVEPLDASPLNALTKLDAAALNKIAPRRVMDVSMPEAFNSGSQRSGASDEDVPNGEAGEIAPRRVLARWNDSKRRPAVIERRVGNGRVLLWTVTADKAWSDWPTQPSYVLGVRRCVAGIAGSSGNGGRNLNAGSPLIQPVDQNQPPGRAKVTPPGAGSARLASVVRSESDPAVIRYNQTLNAGLYSMQWRDSANDSRSRMFAVNPAPSESDLRPIEDAALTQLLSPLSVRIIRFGENASDSADQIELWRTLAFGLLGLVLLESIVASYVGRER